MATVKLARNRFQIRCDDCHFTPAETFTGKQLAAMAEIWKRKGGRIFRRAGVYVHLCPDCAERADRELLDDFAIRAGFHLPKRLI
jgi:hypothetical protein